jgi:DNA sulfur modification protein DndC
MSEPSLTKQGLKVSVAAIVQEIQDLYTEDGVPWVIGYSGGKDSTAVLQLVWTALAKLEPAQRTKAVHVISTDTLVENPVVSAWVERSHEVMRQSAKVQGLPVAPHRLTPDIASTFWVNLIGRGYPAPRPKFRWCTERLKIKPSNKFILDVVRSHGQAILVLGTRKAESALRARTMVKYEKHRVRDRLSPNGSLPGSWIYSPIEAWSNDDVWMFLTQYTNPWGWSNHDLMGMYAGATEGGECPLVVDTSTPSCGDSRFGCWVCTLVDKDKSMAAMIQNDTEKEWMLPLLDLRNALDTRDFDGFRDDVKSRDFRRIDGRLTLEMTPREPPNNPVDRKAAARRVREVKERFTQTGRVHIVEDGTLYYLVHGPYLQSWREGFLRKVLEVQMWLRQNAPTQVRDLKLISIEELEEIRKIWVLDKRETEDSVPRIYREVTGCDYPGPELDDYCPYEREDLELLRKLCMREGDQADAKQSRATLRYDLIRNLLDVERRYRSMARRAGLFDAIERTLEQHAFESEADALRFALEEHKAKTAGNRAVHRINQEIMPIVLDPMVAAEADLASEELDA